MENNTYKYDLIAEAEKKLGTLTDKEKNLEIQQMEEVEPYGLDVSQAMLLRKMYNNNYLKVAGNEFYYGFYQGMQYMKNQQKKQEGAAV